MSKPLTFCTLLTMVLLAAPRGAWADITLTNGSWSTTFDCADWVHPDSGACDGLTLTGGGAAGQMTNKTQITAAANYAPGEGGKGIRFWVGSGDEDWLSAPIYIHLPQPKKELWVRYYTRWETGFAWQNGNPHYEKAWYIRTYPSGDPSAIPGFAQDYFRVYNQGGSSSGTYPVAANKGWSYLYPGGTSDGSWYVAEFYIKMNSSTGSTDGAGRIWLNGTLVAEETAMNWSGASSDALQGFIHLMFRSNQRWVDFTGEKYVDYDDIALYTTTPPNRDAAGNPFIGPLGGGGPITPPLPPQNLRVVR